MAASPTPPRRRHHAHHQAIRNHRPNRSSRLPHLPSLGPRFTARLATGPRSHGPQGATHMRLRPILTAVVLVSALSLVLYVFYSLGPSFGPPSHISDTPICGTPPIDQCGSYSGVMVTPPASPSPPLLLNHHPDAPIQIFDAGDALHIWLIGVDNTRYFVCQSRTIPDLLAWYQTSGNPVPNLRWRPQRVPDLLQRALLESRTSHHHPRLLPRHTHSSPHALLHHNRL